jgi:hypothetical protein
MVRPTIPRAPKKPLGRPAKKPAKRKSRAPKPAQTSSSPPVQESAKASGRTSASAAWERGRRPGPSSGSADHLASALRQEIVASARDREILIQKVLSLTAQLIQLDKNARDQVSGIETRAASEQQASSEQISRLRAERDSLVQARGHWTSAQEEATATISALRAELAEVSDQRAKAEETVRALAKAQADTQEFAQARIAQVESDFSARLASADAAFQAEIETERQKALDVEQAHQKALAAVEKSAADRIADTISALRAELAEISDQRAKAEETVRALAKAQADTQEFAQARIAQVESDFSARMASADAAFQAEIETERQKALDVEQAHQKALAAVEKSAADRIAEANDAMAQAAASLAATQTALDAARQQALGDQQAVKAAEDAVAERMKAIEADFASRLAQADAAATTAASELARIETLLAELQTARAESDGQWTLRVSELETQLRAMQEAAEFDLKRAGLEHAETKASAEDYRNKLAVLAEEYVQTVRDRDQRIEALMQAAAFLESTNEGIKLEAEAVLNEITEKQGEKIRLLESTVAALLAEKIDGEARLAAAAEQHQRDVAALAATLQALEVEKTTNEAEAAKQIAALNQDLALKTEATANAILRADQAAGDYANRVREFQSAFAVLEQQKAQIEQRLVASEQEIGGHFSQRLLDAEEALRVLEYDRAEKIEAHRKAQVENSRLREELDLAQRQLTLLKEVRERSREVEERGWRLERELSSALEELQRERETACTIASQAEMQATGASAAAGEATSLAALQEELQESRERHAVIIDALENDLKNVIAELAAQDGLLASSGRHSSHGAAKEEGTLANAGANCKQDPGAAARQLSAEQSRKVAANGHGHPVADANLLAELEGLRTWRAFAEGELQRLRADRTRIDDELEHATQELDQLNSRLGKSVYWRMRRAARRLVVSPPRPTKTTPTERSTWPQD